MRRCTIETEMSTEQDAYDELCSYTLTHGDPAFIHQHVVDAAGAQTATSDTKPIRLAFSLVGLLLHVEWKWTGREVQRAHMRLAARRRDWPRFALPEHRGSLTAADVVAVPPGPDRDRAIDAWSRAVWEAYAAVHAQVEALVAEHGIERRG
jgi:hypothetical protein